MSASLVMRDRETDSWWSIMTSTAIGGELAGEELVELPLGEKITWGDWVRRYPTTLLLSIDGRQHIDSNPYDSYFASDGTYGDVKIADRRLDAKEPVYSFRIEDRPFASPFAAFAGGRVFPLADGRSVLLTRPRNAPLMLSTRGFLVAASVEAVDADASKLLERLGELGDAVTPLEGYDTFWYTWISVNPDSELLR